MNAEHSTGPRNAACRKAGIALAVAALALTAAPRPVDALTIEFSTTGNAQVDAGFAEAGQLWSSLIADDITIRIDAGYTNLGAGTLGGANPSSIGAFYTEVRSALTTRATSAADLTAVANLPSGNTLSFITNNPTTGERYLDNNASGNNSTLEVTRANAKALGLIDAHNAVTDATIEFNTLYTFDFDRSDGIAAGSFDFVGVAFHEIGHALGFFSGVDIVDHYYENALGSLDTFRVFSVLDLYRRSADALAEGPNVLDLAFDGTPYFSIDGSTSLGQFSTGYYNGNGWQASHWWPDGNMGALRPGIPMGTVIDYSALDLLAFDVIGYTLVPEPTAVSLLAIASFALVRRQRRA